MLVIIITIITKKAICYDFIRKIQKKLIKDRNSQLNPCSIEINCLRINKALIWYIEFMSESMQIIIGIFAVLVVYLLAMLGTGWWTKQVSLAIMKELEDRGAINAVTAVDLPYDKISYFKVGYRDYRPKALEMLVLSEIVCKTFQGRYYLDKEKTAVIHNKGNV